MLRIEIDKSEKKGLYTIMTLYLISWGMIVINNSIFRLIGWVSLGLIGFSLWRIIENLMERGKETKEKGGKIKNEQKRTK